MTAPRLATLEQARDTGRTTVSNRTALPGDLDLPPSRRPVAFELFVPVYRTELPAGASVTARRRQFLGWAVGQFRAGDFLEAALGSLPPPRTTGVELHDGGARRRQPDRQLPRGLPGHRPVRADGVVHLRGADLHPADRPPSGRPAPASRCAWPCSTSTTSRPTTTPTATRPVTGCSRRRPQPVPRRPDRHNGIDGPDPDQLTRTGPGGRAIPGRA